MRTTHALQAGPRDSLWTNQERTHKTRDVTRRYPSPNSPRGGRTVRPVRTGLRTDTTGRTDRTTDRAPYGHGTDTVRTPYGHRTGTVRHRTTPYRTPYRTYGPRRGYFPGICVQGGYLRSGKGSISMGRAGIDYDQKWAIPQGCEVRNSSYGPRQCKCHVHSPMRPSYKGPVTIKMEV